MTRALIAAADACSDPAERTTLLLQVAALNADLALAITSALCQRHRNVTTDDPVLREQVQEAYLHAVVHLPRGADLMSAILPALRATVAAYSRSQDAVLRPSRR